MINPENPNHPLLFVIVSLLSIVTSHFTKENLSCIATIVAILASVMAIINYTIIFVKLIKNIIQKKKNGTKHTNYTK